MYNADGSGRDPPIPHGTQPLHNQVAGHVFGRGKTKLGFLQLGDGTVVKPIHGCLSEESQILRRKSELVFYERVFDKDCTDPTLVSLRPFLPTFYGTWQTEQHPGITYLQLEDITLKYKHPCIMDVKMGRITYAPDAEPEKIQQEISKYPPAADIGFQLIGTRVYQQDTGQDVVRDRHYLRSLTPQQIYDEGGTETVGSGTVGTDIRMIDFPRVFPAQTTDDNYLTGLQNLITHFQSIVQ